MHYLIDGYNFLFKLESFEKNFEKRRRALITLLNSTAQSLRGGVSVVFDSSEEIRDAPQKIPLDHIEVIYAPRGQSADAHIIEIVEHSKRPKIMIVVTSDRGLARACKGLQANTMSIEEFMVVLEKKGTPKQQEEKWSRDAPSHMLRLQKIFEDLLKDSQ